MDDDRQRHWLLGAEPGHYTVRWRSSGAHHGSDEIVRTRRTTYMGSSIYPRKMLPGDIVLDNRLLFRRAEDWNAELDRALTTYATNGRRAASAWEAGDETLARKYLLVANRAMSRAWNVRDGVNEQLSILRDRAEVEGDPSVEQLGNRVRNLDAEIESRATPWVQRPPDRHGRTLAVLVRRGKQPTPDGPPDTAVDPRTRTP